MKKDVVLQVLRDHQPQLEKMGIGHLYLFGSVARDEAGPDSDVDLFFEYNDPHFNLLDLVGVKLHLTELLNTNADVMTRCSLHPVLKADIESSALQVY